MSLIRLNLTPSAFELRWFGWLWFPLFVLASGFLAHKWIGGWEASSVVWILGAVTEGAMLAAPRFARSVYVGLSLATYPIGVVVSQVVLVLMYFLVITPIGLILRIGGRDVMNRQFERDATTYWRERAGEHPPSDYFNQS